MQLSCGTDIIEIDRIKDSIDSLGDKFINRIYTKNEINYCESKNAMKYQHYAARFAAKEATFKAISNYLDNKYNIDWKNIELVNDNNGRPKINFINVEILKLNQLDVSISHCKQYATACVVAMFNN